ncbi:MAG: DNA helicase RecQ [Phycisphaerae bacterium]
MCIRLGTMGMARRSEAVSASEILSTVRTVWGFDALRPLQERAIRAELVRRDSLVVMPTGGGKSLCYQVPPLLAGRTDVVVSPLISLMKDQVDGLKALGYPAETLHSGLTQSDQATAGRRVVDGSCRLIFVSPERLLSPFFMAALHTVDVGSFAIDEAHCISHWGHDFRLEYRRLTTLKDRFPDASGHAYTATATQRVRDDIIAQLGLDRPEVLVGDFDRPNLTYRVIPRVDPHEQAAEIIGRHEHEAVIVYCMTRKDTENMALALRHRGTEARAYHAGMDAAERHKIQDAFAGERVNVIAATVAFGMGIDRSNVRCVIHASMPKSVEHYQQEVGRAGRDGLEAECVLLYSAADVMRWESLFARSAEEAEEPEEVLEANKTLVRQMQRFANVPQCRHRLLVEHFGQSYDRDNCEACDVCLGDVVGVEDQTVVAQKILSCVARLQGRFGVGHVVDVLRGADTENIRRFGSDQVSTYGLLKDVDRKALVNSVYQLVDQGLLDRTSGERPVLQLNEVSWEVMRGRRKVLLLKPKAKRVRRTRGERESWEGVDRGLFERLRSLRGMIAKKRGVPAYVIFGDATLRDMARQKPRNEAGMLAVHGVGQAKLAQFGRSFLEAIAEYNRA